MTARNGLLTAAVAAVIACAPEQAAPPSVNAWLLCEDCTEAELDSAAAVGNLAVLPLGQALLRGPTQTAIENISHQATASYDAVQRAARGQARPTRAEYVRVAAENFKATYQSRAAILLERIGTTSARAVLLDAAQHDSGFRADVRRQIGRILGLTLAVVSGDSQTVAGGLVIPTPIVLQVTDASTAPVSGIPVRFAVDAGSGVLADTRLVTDATGRVNLQDWRVVGGWSTTRATAAGRTVLVTGRADPPYAATVFRATLAGANHIPAASTPATGVVTLQYTGAAINGDVFVSDVSDVVSVLVYVGGPTSTAGPRVLALCGAISTPACASGPGTVFTGTANLSITLGTMVDSLRRQQTYVRVFTASHPGGLLRGQLLSIFP